MSGKELYTFNNFDMDTAVNERTRLTEEGQSIAAVVLKLSQVTIDFADIERAPRYYAHKRENNAEHSFMLGLTAVEIAEQYFPGLDSGLIAKFALVHDLVELETMDMPTFTADEIALEAKARAEESALLALLETLPPSTGCYLERYEYQKEPEARLVRHIDKLLPFSVNINGAGKLVMEEDYGITSAADMLTQTETVDARFRRMFPEVSHQPLHAAHSALALRFALQYGEV